ncbi:Acyl-protein thioesterase 1 [Pestalotiopsis fici W106-1]|uniref:Acyl-protein thioesterase 1 n=1 Tax=Pestalotiopsis fici (strain W106-1 / CGMCC3.15140) TaxID=1229662 RepID=W3XE86_PESFW|nr:Acyl-protein thioesterase 1 [Pestalotiopsis fici W106-1]ETS84360.1 Acyl-protein thioesterase 1 [Pestalotiopsis fici W106-1]
MSGLKRLPPLLLPAPAARHTATVIFFHGLGDTGYGWADAVQNWRRRSKLDEVKFILPHAPQIPITCNGGMRMPGWYDIVALTGAPDDLRRQQDEAGMLVSRAYISGLIQAEIDNGVPADRIVLGGFSQGGAMSLFAGLTTPRKIAGIVGMSSYLPLDAKLPEFLGEGNHNQDTPILMCHGTADNVVPASAGRSSAELLKKTGFDVTWKEYPGMAHSACLEELDDVEAFLASRLPALGEEKRSEL